MRKHKYNESGFSHVIILIVAVLFLVVGFAGYRVLKSNDKSNNASSSNEITASSKLENRSSDAEPKLILQNLGIDINKDVLVTKDALREYESVGLKGFYVFGEKLGGKQDTRLNPNFEFSSLRSDTKLISAIDGVVGFIKEQPETKDYEVFVQPKENSKWTVGYDHVVNPQLKKGDKVKAGDAIGSPALQNNGAYRFEIQINLDENGSTTHYCPSSLLDQSKASGILADLGKMQSNWNVVSGLNLYNLSDQSPTGCKKPTLTPAEAEGR